MATEQGTPRERDPGLQPERTALAWLRTLLGYGALLMLAVRHSWQQAGMLLWLAALLLLAAGTFIYGYLRQRKRGDLAICDFSASGTVQRRLLIALGVAGLALLFAVSHLEQALLLSAGG